MDLGFGEDVLSKNPEACLPASLTDHWLRHLAEEADSYLEGKNDQCTDLFSATIYLLMAKEVMIKGVTSTQDPLSIDLEQVADAVERYTIELGMEELFRAGRLDYNPATLETIFDDRNLEISNVR